MKATLLLLCSAALVAHNVDVREVATTLKYAPSAETEMRTTWTLDWDLESTMAGIPSLGIENFDTTLKIAGELSWSALSALQVSKGARLAAITRTYEEAQRSIKVVMPSGHGFQAIQLKDAGTTRPIDVPVLFEAGDDDFEASFVRQAIELRPTEDMERLLDHLTPRLDAVNWLHLGERQAGDEWLIGARDFESLWFPTADPASWFWHDRASPQASDQWDESLAQTETNEFERKVLGDTRATYLGLQAVDGALCAHIALQIDQQITMVVPGVNSLVARAHFGTPAPFESAPMHVDAQLDGTGVLLWDIASKRLVSLRIEVEATVDMTFGSWWQIADGDGPARFIEYKASLEGPLNWSLTEVEE